MVDYYPCKHGYHRVGSRCVKDGSKGRISYPAKKRPPTVKPGGSTGGSTGGGTSSGGTGTDSTAIPNPVATTPTTSATTSASPTGDGTAASTAQPFAGTITPAVADSGDTGTSEAPAGGDMTGTSQLVSEMASVFSSGQGYTPQYQGVDYAAQPVTATNVPLPNTAPGGTGQ